MYVRWQTYRSQALDPSHRARNDRRARLKAVLVESVRVGGKPRQKHIAFLGSIELDDPKKIVGDSDHARFWRRMSAIAKVGLWRRVMRRLDQLGNRVGPEERARLLASIAERVGSGPPTAAELEQFDREGEALGIRRSRRPDAV
jgi:hypothetical protein